MSSTLHSVSCPSVFICQYELFSLSLPTKQTKELMATVDDKKIIFSMVGVSKIIPQNQKQILKNIYLSFFYGAKIGIIGLNGAGKSTLMKIIAGLVEPTQGEVVWSPGYSVGYLPQDPPLDEAKTVKENVMEGVQHIYDALKEYDDINVKFGLEEYYSDADKMDKLMQRQAELQDIIDATDAWNIDSRLERAMDALRCPKGDLPVTNLSGGERRRVALCRLLLQKPDVLLLDEPTNHLDAESIDWLEQHLQQYEGTVIAVTHDRYFLDDVSEWILELDRGEGIPWKGNYSSWLDQKTKRMEQEEKSASKRRKTLERELEWVRMAPKARQAKGKARLNSYEQMLNEEQKQREEKLEIFIPNGPRLGNKVIEAQHVQKAFGEKVLFNDLNFMLPPNGIVGVIGPNGAGKTTLFRLIMGLEQADGGTFEVGETVKLAYVDQQHKDIDPNKTVYDVVSQGNETIRMGGRDINSRAYLSRFNFSGTDQSKLCSVLSGGERNRLQLAMALKQEGNVLLLDEPTNDIDVNTLRALEEGLEAFAGCAVVISHDRWFLDRICTHILAFEGNGEVVYFEGGFSDYEINKARRLGNEEIKKGRYRKLMEE
jgi:ATP-binding cassette protein, chvD family